MYLPAYKHTHLSEVNVTRLPERVGAVRLGVAGLERFDLALKDKSGRLRDAKSIAGLLYYMRYLARVPR